VGRATKRTTQARSGRDAGPGVRERWAFAAAAASLAVLFMGNNLPSALYGLLRTAFGYSSLTQTLLYAVPVVLVILPGLLVFGTLSDVIGRRAPIVAGLVVFAGGDIAFMAAAGTGLLFGARLLQGLGIALGTAAAAATLSDCAAGLAVDRVRAQKIAAVTGTICITGGLALGPLVGGILAQYAPDPRVTPFAVHLALIVTCIILAARIPGRPVVPAGRWRLARLHVPGAIRAGFPVIAVSGFLSWSVLGVFSAVIATLMTIILHTGNLAVTAGTLTLMIGTSAVAQIGAPRLQPVTAQWAGLTALAAGLVLLAAAAAVRSAALTVPALIGSGAGHGLIFAGNQSAITVATPAAERGAVLGVVYFINYLGLGVPVIIVGVMSLRLGLLKSASIASVVIAVACVLLIPFAFRARTGKAS
jgi:MFS family permease